MRYLINSAVISNDGWGTYEYLPASEADLDAFVRFGDVVSAIGYQATADFIEAITGVAVPVSRVSYAMVAGDEAMVVRLKYRVPDPRRKHDLAPAPGDFEIGLLRCLSRVAVNPVGDFYFAGTDVFYRGRYIGIMTPSGLMPNAKRDFRLVPMANEAWVASGGVVPVTADPGYEATTERASRLQLDNPRQRRATRGGRR